MFKWFKSYKKLYLIKAHKTDPQSPLYTKYYVFEARFRKDAMIGRANSLQGAYKIIFKDRGNGPVRIDVTYE